MREYKFRGKTINDKWVYGLLSISKGLPGQPEKGFYISNKSGMPWAYQVRPETVGEYSGKKDKNKKEIYEDDIVRGCYGIPPLGIKAVVEYDGAAFIIRTPGHHPELCTLKIAIECLDIEVIGKMYENPELLK